MKTKNFFLALLCLFVLFYARAALAQVQEHTSFSDSNDCTDITVDYESDPNLTRQEKIEHMDKALFHSLNKYEGCQNIRANASASGGAANANKGGSGSGAESTGSGSSSASSTASSDMSGTETPAEQETTTNSLSDKTETSATVTNESKHGQNVHVKGSGKIPDDIPKVDNDSVLEAQIRQAAMTETDPAIKAKLWNEYRKYKGLPVQ